MCNRKTPGVSEQLSGDSRNNRVQSINRHTRGQKQPRIHLIGSYCLYKLHIMSAKKTVWKLSLLRSLQDTICANSLFRSGASFWTKRRMYAQAAQSRITAESNTHTIQPTKRTKRAVISCPNREKTFTLRKNKRLG